MDKIRQKARWVYEAQKARCYNRNCPAYKNYGAKGIGVRYTLKEFYKWYLENYKPGFICGRIDHSKSYSLDNLIAEDNIRVSTIERNERFGNPSKHKMKKVLVIHQKTNTLVAIFSNIKDTAETMGSSVPTIIRSCRKHTEKTFGKWKYQYADC